MSSAKTETLKLNTWAPTDYVNMGEFNDNFQKIDEAHKEVATQLAENETQLTDVAVNARKYGLNTNATWDVNRNALQQANDYVASLGGGTVLIPPGKYTVKGVWQDSRVEFKGEGVTLVHPDGSSQDMIRSRVYSTTGTIATGSNQLTVADVSRIEVGTLVAIRGAKGLSPFQNTTLASDITATQVDGITLTDITGFSTVGYLIVDNEIIEYTGLSGNVLTGVTRGRVGTTATTHTAGAVIGVALRLIAGVTAINGTTITLDEKAVIGVTDSNVNIGILSPKITGLLFDGNLVPEGAFLTCNPVRWDLVRYGRFDFKVQNAESIIYLNYSSDNEGVVFGRDVTKPLGTIGSGVWLFQNCHRNKVYANFTGDTWAGVYLDNRTSKGSEFDGSCDFNQGEVVVNSDYFDKLHTTTGLLVVGGNHNNFTVKTKKVHTGFSLKNGDQIYSYNGTLPTTKGNHIIFNVLEGYQPHVVYAPGNVVSGYYETVTEGYFYDGNVRIATPLKQGGNPVLGPFPAGTYNNPGITFNGDENTGFYLIADGQVQFVSNSDSIVRLRSTGMFLADGKNLEFNTGTGNKIGSAPTQKIGFWGATPIAKPTGMPGAAKDLASALTLLNYIRSQLYNMGLMDIQ